MTSTTIWNDDVIRDLRTLTASGLSATEISLELSRQYRVRVSRNAVIGKQHRVGLVIDRKKTARHPKRQHLPGPKPLPRIELIDRKPRLELIISNETHMDGAITIEQRFPYMNKKTYGEYELADLTTNTCHWPMGAFHDRPPYKFCGRPTVTVIKKSTTSYADDCHSSWCRFHYAKATTTARMKI